MEGYYYVSMLSIRYVPQKYEKLVRTQGFKVYVDDHREETYQPPPPRFGYKGNTLGTSQYVLG